MIKQVDITTDGCSGLGDMQACLDYPKCGYHDDDTILIAGWVLPSEPLNNDVHVIIRVDENQQLHDFRTNKITRPDVFKAKLPNSQLPVADMQVGFSVRIPFSHSTNASIIISKNGEELVWYKLSIVVDDALTSFVRNISQATEHATNVINLHSITSSTKIFHPHTFNQHPSSVAHAHLNKICNAVKIDEFIVALYTSENGHVHCLKSALNFEICSSRTINEHVFLFCRDETGIEFIIHQYVTSIDGIYYPSKGIYYTFCHHSHNRLETIIKLLFDKINYFKSNKFKDIAFLIGHSRPYHFMYDGMLGLETIYQHVNKIDEKIQFYTLESQAFIDAPKVYCRNQTASFINNKKLTLLEQEGTIFVKIGSLFGSGAKDSIISKKMQSLDKRITTFVDDIHCHNSNIIFDLKKHFPIIWIGVTGQKRAWLEQIEGYANIINELYKSYPGMAIVFDGWTSSLITTQLDKMESEKDHAITNEIKNRIAADITIIDLVGATIDRKIHIGSVIDCAIVNYSTGSINVSRICGRPCVTHMNNGFSPARDQHIHKDAYHIPDEYVTDVLDENSRIDSTNYHIDWTNIYNALVTQLRCR